MKGGNLMLASERASPLSVFAAMGVDDMRCFDGGIEIRLWYSRRQQWG